MDPLIKSQPPSCPILLPFNDLGIERPPVDKEWYKDLRTVVCAWPGLPENVREAILLLVAPRAGPAPESSTGKHHEPPPGKGGCGPAIEQL